jgi:hypothetical protein
MRRVSLVLMALLGFTGSAMAMEPGYNCPDPHVPPKTAHERQFTLKRNATGDLQIEISGEIELGDADQFEATVRYVTEPVLVLLNSPGGKVKDALAISREVNTRGWDTHVSGQCSSACFIIFAAGHRRTYASNSRIGVHSASVHHQYYNDFQETDGSLTATMQIVRTIQSFKMAQPIPAMIFGKLVSAPPKDMAILTRDDLEAMDAQMDLPSGVPSTATIIVSWTTIIVFCIIVLFSFGWVKVNFEMNREVLRRVFSWIARQPSKATSWWRRDPHEVPEDQLVAVEAAKEVKRTWDELIAVAAAREAKRIWEEARHKLNASSLQPSR